MKYTCADFTFPLLQHDKVLDLLRLLDFDAVDLGIFEGRSHHYPSRVAVDPLGEARAMKAKLAARGMVASDVFLQTGEDPPVHAVNDPDPDVRVHNRQLFRAMVDYTTELGCNHMTGLPGVLHNGVDPRDDLRLAESETAWRVEAAASAGVTYAIESHVGSIIPDPSSALEFLGHVPGLTLTLDYGHYLYQGMNNESVHPLIPHASHFHARGGANGMLQSTVSDNTIDFATIIRHFVRSGYSGYVCLEYVWVDWEGCNRTDNISETILLRDHLRGLERAG